MFLFCMYVHGCTPTHLRQVLADDACAVRGIEGDLWTTGAWTFRAAASHLQHTQHGSGCDTGWRRCDQLMGSRMCIVCNPTPMHTGPQNACACLRSD